MRCPRCNESEDHVVESRALADGRSIRRRRECLSCGYRFTSYERVEEKLLLVVKRDGSRREPFDRGKIEKGVQQALRKRPVSQQQIQNIIDELEEECTREGMESHEIGSTRIGDLVLEALYEIDRVAYVRFASVYRNYEDVQQFMNEIKALTRKEKPRKNPRRTKSSGEGI